MAASRSTLRTDARRNADRIRVAALDVFREHGLAVPLEQVAAEAGVSKATIFNRFGGRVGLIDAVIEDVVAIELRHIVEDTRSLPEVAERIAYYFGAFRDLQYRRPAANDVLLQEFPHSEQLMAICHLAGGIHDELVEAGHAAGVLAHGFTPDDLRALLTDNALALKHGERPPRSDYDRRTAFVIGGICGPSHPSA